MSFMHFDASSAILEGLVIQVGATPFGGSVSATSSFSVSAGFEWRSDGSRVLLNFGAPIPNGNWAEPPALLNAADYEIFFLSTGTIGSSGTYQGDPLGVWLPLTTAKQIETSGTRFHFGVDQFAVDIRNIAIPGRNTTLGLASGTFVESTGNFSIDLTAN